MTTTEEKLKEIRDRAKPPFYKNRDHYLLEDVPYLLALVEKQRASLKKLDGWISCSFDHTWLDECVDCGWTGSCELIEETLNYDPKDGE